MFLASDKIEHREHKVRGFLRSEPGIALILAAINFEWTISRAVMFLSKTKTPNKKLREKLASYYSPQAYKELWKAEISMAGKHESLAKVISNWTSVLRAFRLATYLCMGGIGTQPRWRHRT